MILVVRFEHDQELDSLLVGPVPVGVNKFIFEADPPSPDLIPASELVSVTVILLSCSYASKEFVRVGYYVNNEYDDEELRLNPPPKVQIDRVVRNILAEKPRVTRFNISWDNEGPADEFPPEQPEADLAVDDEEAYGAEDDQEDEEEQVEEVGEEEIIEEDEEEQQTELDQPNADQNGQSDQVDQVDQVEESEPEGEGEAEEGEEQPADKEQW